MAVHQDPAGPGIKKPEQHAHQGAFPGSTRTHDGNDLTRPGLKRHLGEDWPIRFVSHCHIFIANMTPESNGTGIGSIANIHRIVQHL